MPVPSSYTGAAKHSFFHPGIKSSTLQNLPIGTQMSTGRGAPAGVQTVILFAISAVSPPDLSEKKKPEGEPPGFELHI
jgi:hypothetical protein